MRKVSIAIAVFVWVNFCLMSVLAAGVTISSLNASIDPSNKRITVSGIISSEAGRQVSIRVIDPNGYDDFLYQTVSGTNGYFNISYTTGNTTMGIYTVKVGGYGISTPVKTVFDYGSIGNPSPALTGVPGASPSGTPVTKPSHSERVTITILNASINLSTKLITISGKISSGEGKQVAIRVTGPNNKDDFLYQVASGYNGNFLVSYTTQNTAYGTYTVRVGGYGVLTPVKTTFVYKDTVTSSPAKTPAASPTTTAIIATMSATPTPISTLVKPMLSVTPVSTVTPMLTVTSVLTVAPVPTVTPTVLPASSVNPPPPANPPVVSISNGGSNVVSTTSPTVLPTPEKTPIVEPMVKIPDMGSFTDIKGHWSFNYIKVLLEKGILAGYSDGTIKPDIEITRLETVAIVIRAIGIKPERNVSLDFSDKNDIPAWARGYVQVASEKGIVAGYPDKTFRPNKKISRAEMIAIVNNAFNLGKSTNTIHDFADVKKIQPWVKGYIARAYELGLIKGYKDNTFKPDNNITRGEVFVVITNSINLKKYNK